jgi:hypothetical protein
MYSPRSMVMIVPPSQRTSAAKWASASEPAATCDTKRGGTGQVCASTVFGESDHPVRESK